MAYQTYTTDAIVCGSREHGDADRTFWLFTRDAGMVIARASSVRKNKSKLRYALQDFSLVRVSLVRGKNSWRITGADSLTNLYTISTTRESRGAVLRGIKLLRRFIHGEDPYVNLFVIAEEGLTHLASKECDTDITEMLFALRALNQLGYIAPHHHFSEMLLVQKLRDSETIFHSTPSNHASIKRAVEDALVASQL